MFLRSLCLMGTALLTCGIHAQSPERLRLMEAEEARIRAYVQHHLDAPLPERTAALFEAPSADHDQVMFTAQERAAWREEHVRLYWRARYFQEHPEAAKVFRGTGDSCADGDFEAGDLGTFTPYSGVYDNGECDGAPSITYFEQTFGTNAMHFKLTDNIPDPITGFGQTNGGSQHGMRINGPKGTPTCGLPNGGINKLTATVVLQQPEQHIGFYYALVLQSPSTPNNPHENEQPFFSVRAVGPDGLEQDQVCQVVDLGSAFLSDLTSGTYPVENCSVTATVQNPIVYSDWTCARLTVSGDVGDEITLEFYAADCGQSAHFGYAYVDDICAPCDSPATGLVTLDPFQGCVDGPILICGSYVPPVIDGVPGTVTGWDLSILQNGSDVTVGSPVLVSHDGVAHTFCFEVVPGNFPAPSGGYDLNAALTFSYGNTEDDEHSTPGLNNDVYLGASCCAVEIPTGFICYPNSGANGGGMLMSWDPVPGAVQYEVEVVTHSQACCPGVAGTPQTHTFTSLSDDPDMFLLNAGFYPCATWRVRARCAADQWSPWSEPQCLCTPNTCATQAPAAPTCAMIAGANGGSAVIDWASLDGALSYEIQVTTFSQACCAGNTGTPQTFTFTSTASADTLFNAGYYPCATVRIRGRCYGQYWSPWSTPTCLCTPAFCPATPVVSGLQCDNDNNVVELDWTAVPYAMYYEVNVRTHTCSGCTPTGTSVNYLYTAGGNSFTLPLPGSAYPCAMWTVRAVCASGATTNWAPTQCLCGNTSGCAPLIVNGSFTTSSSAGPLSNCVVMPQGWKSFVSGLHSSSKMYVPILNGTSLNPLLNFANAVNPPSWNGSPYNTRYVSMYLRNPLGTSVSNGRAGLWQALSPGTVNGGHYFIRVRYASYVYSGTQGSFNLRTTLSNTAVCPPGGALPNATPINENVAVSNSGVGSVVWHTVTKSFNATAALSSLTVEARAVGLAENTEILVYLDEVELVRYDCPMDLNGDGLINVDDIIILTGYMGQSVNSIQNLCHAGADADGDGEVDQADLDLFMAEFGEACPNGMVLQQQKSLADAPEGSSLTALPNPTTGLLTVMHPEVEQGRLEVLAINGDVVLSLRVSGTTTPLDLRGSPAGLYLVRLTTATGEQHTLRVVRE